MMKLAIIRKAFADELKHIYKNQQHEVFVEIPGPTTINGFLGPTYIIHFGT
jgi:hypothetical protein